MGNHFYFLFYFSPLYPLIEWQNKKLNILGFSTADVDNIFIIPERKNKKSCGNRLKMPPVTSRHP
jgi:hypothetical protein